MSSTKVVERSDDDGRRLEVEGAMDRNPEDQSGCVHVHEVDDPEKKWSDFTKKFDGSHLILEGKLYRKSENQSYDFRYQKTDSLEKIWSDFKREKGKTYKDSAEEQFRKRCFEETLERIALHNESYANGKTTFTTGINQFADMAKGESPCCCSRGRKP